MDVRKKRIDRSESPAVIANGTRGLDQAAELAWLHYIGGFTQAEIATRRGLSPMKVHRFIQLAHENGLVRISVDRVPEPCAELESQLMRQYGLSSCTVVPEIALDDDMFASLPLVTNAAARYLHGRLESTESRIIGIGSGRTISMTIKALATIRRENIRFVSLTGDFAVLNDANPFEVINTLIQKTGGSGHAFTAPLIVESPEDRDVFLRQRGVAKVMELAARADFLMSGIGHVGANSFFRSYDLLSSAEQRELARAKVSADLVGNLIDEDGQFVQNELAQRMLAVSPAVLRDRELIAVCSGAEKWLATRSCLRSGCLNGLITTYGIAKRILEAS